MINAWLAGRMTTEELHSEMMDPEYLRWLREDYIMSLWDRWEDMWNQR